MKVRVHLPIDMTEIYKKIDEYKAKKIVKEYTTQQVEEIIKYFKESRRDYKIFRRK